MKKTAFKQPRQAAENADLWVKGGSAVDTAPEREAELGGKLARLTIDLPPALHSRFKAACAQQRTKMKAEVLQFIETWTTKHENTEK